MLKKISRLVFCFAFILTLIIPAKAYALTETSSQGYSIILDDQADFFTDSQEADLMELMQETGQYGNVVLITTTNHSYNSTDELCTRTFEDKFGRNSKGIVFAIDRDLNKIYIISEGSLRSTINTGKANSITDNTYIYATKANNYDYYTCAMKSFEQINTLLAGGKINQPMKIISNVLFAIVLAMFINFFIAFAFSKSKKPSMAKLLEGSYTNVEFQNPRHVHTHQSKRYSPRSSSSGGSSGGGGGGGGHSGGGHSI